MNKFAVIIQTIIVVLFFSSISQATLITNLTQAELDSGDYSNAEDHLTSDLLGVNYINYKGFDWAWASKVNIEDFEGVNTLYAPGVQKNWQFADAGLLKILKEELDITDFTDDNNQIIHASSFFNSTFVDVDGINFRPDSLSSEWVSADNPWASLLGAYETFYVRKTVTNNPKPIPEPLSIFIFATALIALQIKMRNKSV